MDKQKPDDQQDPFSRLSRDTISEILSRTTPFDALRAALVSKVFKSAADSDSVWEKFLPLEILSRSDYSSSMDFGTIKELYSSLHHSPIPLDGGKLSFFLDRSGKKCVTVGAKELIIPGGSNPQHWIWTSHANSRFSTVAHLKSIYWLDVIGKINTQMLSPKTVYAAYLVFNLSNIYYGLDSVDAVVRLLKDEPEVKNYTLLHLHEASPMYRSPQAKQTGELPVMRDDGWMEIKMGTFYNDEGDAGEVEARLMEVRRSSMKSGLIVEGIEFRPYKTWSNYYKN